MKFSEQMFAYHRAESDFSDALCEAGFGAFNRIGGDDYDNSIEFYDVANDARMSEAAQRLIYDVGFGTAFVNHMDGWETHYSWKQNKPFEMARGWRRRWVADPQAKTTRLIGARPKPENGGYYEISYWPEGWGDQTKDWLTTGYMRIVPDPLEQVQR
jgi:hypothetical protein